MWTFDYLSTSLCPYSLCLDFLLLLYLIVSGLPSTSISHCVWPTSYLLPPSSLCLTSYCHLTPSASDNKDYGFQMYEGSWSESHQMKLQKDCHLVQVRSPPTLFILPPPLPLILSLLLSSSLSPSYPPLNSLPPTFPLTLSLLLSP